MRSARVSCAVSVALLAALTLSACGGDDEAASDEPTESAPTAVAKASDIPGAELVIKPGTEDAPKSYRTAEITHTSGTPDASTVNVDYQAGPDLCSIFTGYATQETESTIEVTVIVGDQAGCTGKPTTRTTVLNTEEPVGDRKVVVSEYSQQSLPIEDPTS